MDLGQHVNLPYSDRFITAEEQRQAWQEAARQARVIRENKLASDKATAGRPSHALRGIGAVLTSVGGWLKGAQVIATNG
jgi:hypothetical protein